MGDMTFDSPGNRTLKKVDAWSWMWKMNAILITRRSPRFIRPMIAGQPGSINISRVVTLAIFLAIAPALSARAQTGQGTSGGDRYPGTSGSVKGSDPRRGARSSIQSHDNQTTSRPRASLRLGRGAARCFTMIFVTATIRTIPAGSLTRGNFGSREARGSESNFDLARAYNPPHVRSTERQPRVGNFRSVLLGGRERDEGKPPVSLKSESEIFTRVGITNAFAAKLELNLRNYAERNTRLEFGPFQGEDRSSGYRLAYDSGRTPTLSLLRFGPNRSAVIEIADQGIALDDGNPHTIEWHRGDDGEMVVLLDNKAVIRTVDRAYDDPFDGFAVINKGGEFELRQVSIFGTN